MTKQNGEKTGLGQRAGNIYYVYSHVDPRSNDLLYIGHGCRSRAWIHGSKRTALRSQDHLDHLEDLTSNGFLANDWVKILFTGLSKSSACQLEQSIIRELNPRYNKRAGLALMKVDAKMLDEIVSLRESGMSYKSIGEVTGVSTMTVFRAANNITKNIGNIK